MQIHVDLKEMGYEGSYDRVAAFARQLKAGQAERVNSSSKRTEEVRGGLANVHLVEEWRGKGLVPDDWG